MTYLPLIILTMLVYTVSAPASDAPFHMNKVLRTDQGEVVKVSSHAIELDEWPSKGYMKFLFIIQGKEKNPTCTIRLNLLKGKTPQHTLKYANGACQVTTVVGGETVSTVETATSKACLALAKDRKGGPCGISDTVDLNGSYGFGF